MGGPAMEVFKFGVYVFVPISMFYYFNLPEFYDNHVRPNLFRAFPVDNIVTNIPHTREGNNALLEKLRAENKAKLDRMNGETTKTN